LFFLAQSAEKFVKGLAGPHGFTGKFRIWLEVASNVLWCGLDVIEFRHNGLFVFCKGLSQAGEDFTEFGAFLLYGKCLSPVEREVKVAATIVEFVDFAGR